MNVQAAPPTYTPAGGNPPITGNAPVLGAQIPGTTGGLPAQGGLSALANPMAQQLQSMGRDEDSMLVHMTPDEVNSLQGLAMAAGGSLTINPQTGLPEASFLKKLLPTLLGAGLSFIPGVGPLMAAGIVGAGQTALTGNLSKGLTAGLQAFGGASLAGGIQGAVGGAKAGAVPPTPTTGPAFTVPAGGGPMPLDALGAAAPPPPAGALGRFGQGFANTAQGNMTGLARKAAVPMAGLGVLSGISDATTPSGFKNAKGQIDNSYEGPYFYEPREVAYRSTSPVVSRDSSPELFFQNSQPALRNIRGELVQPGSNTAPGTMIRQAVLNPNARKNEPMYSFRSVPFMGGRQEEEYLMGFNPASMGQSFAKGGEVQLADGAFVVDARTVSELGNGSSNAGMELLERMGGRPIDGSGDGVSDSIPARIGRDQPARVARDEVLFSPEAVRRVGNGSEKRGAQKLYALMDKAHKARKKAKRGQDTGVHRGLA
jgi:hypothetical protein